MACGGCDEECEGLGGDGAVVIFYFYFWKGGGVLHVGLAFVVLYGMLCVLGIDIFVSSFCFFLFFSGLGVGCSDTIFFPNGYQTKSSQYVHD